MQIKQTLSTQKIIFFIVFICAAIMTSLFLYHMRHQSMAVPTSDNFMIFPVARDIKSFELLSSDNQPFTQQQFRSHWTLLFFGFTHCAKVCPTTLDMLNRVYSKVHTTYPDLQVVLVSLDPERDTKAVLNNYVKRFNTDFIGVSGKVEELRKLQSQLGIFSARVDSKGDHSRGDNYQIQHSSSILLINPQGKWAGMFKYGMNPEQFADALKTSINALSS